MIKTHEREKFVNAVVFFCSHTLHCGKIKLFKLLYLLDFEHFKQTGRSVTGLSYRAWEMGPVPHALWREWPSLANETAESDLAAAIRIEPEKVYDKTLQKVVARVDFDPSFFSKRELKLMEMLAKRFHSTRTEPLIGLTHEEKGPWEKTWLNGLGNDQEIDYLLAASESKNKDFLESSHAEYSSLKERFESKDAASAG